MAQKLVDLVTIFNTVTQTLAQQQHSLDQADDVNHDHGSNMVQTFQTITDSLQTKRGKSASTALAYAARQLTNNTTSTSGQLYAQGLAQAANKFKGKKVDSKGALDLLQTMIGGGQAPSEGSGTVAQGLLDSILSQAPASGQATQPASSASGNDLLEALIGQVMAGAPSGATGAAGSGAGMLEALLGGTAEGQRSKPPATPQAGGDLLSSLLGGMVGNQPSTSGSTGGPDLGDLVNAGLSLLQAKQQGGSTAQALIQAFTSVSGMGTSARRTQSTSLVVDSFLKALVGANKP